MISNAIKALVLIKRNGYAELAGYDGCACSALNIQGVDIETHCWRTSRDNCQCEAIGVHVTGNRGMDAEDERDEQELQAVADAIKAEMTSYWPSTSVTTIVKIL